MGRSRPGVCLEHGTGAPHRDNSLATGSDRVLSKLLKLDYSTMNGSSESNLGMLEEGWMNQEAKVRPHAQAHLLSPTDKCKVCSEPAAKHVHYGAMTCFSCRAFFRRSIQNKTAATYVCRRSKNCEINLKTRKNCQFCRYMRCIAVGMKPTWVLSERA